MVSRFEGVPWQTGDAGLIVKDDGITWGELRNALAYFEAYGALYTFASDTITKANSVVEGLQRENAKLREANGWLVGGLVAVTVTTVILIATRK